MKKTQGLNDGYIEICVEKDNKTDFSAVVTPKSMNDMNTIVALAYKEQYKRQQDYEFAEANDKTLSIKARTLIYDEVTTNHKAVIDGTLYNIFKIDQDKAERVMYLYLEEDRKLG